MNFLNQIINLFRSKSWRNLDALPSEVFSKAELDNMQKEVVDEINEIQKLAIRESGESHSAKPQALFHYHKYIDAKFSKNDFDVDTVFSKKQNIIDQNYAQGLGEVSAELTGYQGLIDQLREVEQRLRRSTNALDPEAALQLDAPGSYDDAAELLEQFRDLPRDLNWKKLKENIA